MNQVLQGNTLKGIAQRAKIYEYLKTCSVPPTIREICEYTGLRSSSTVFCHLRKMEKSGEIYRKPSSPRSIMFATPVTDSEGREMPSVSRLYNESKTRCEELESALNFLLQSLEYEDLTQARTAKAMVRAEKRTAKAMVRAEKVLKS